MPKIRRKNEFFSWLSLQVHRTGDVGGFARWAQRDRFFPREVSQLSVLLLYVEGRSSGDLQRGGLKKAHREWRKSRTARKSRDLEIIKIRDGDNSKPEGGENKLIVNE
jgi:YozE SAM-like fold